MSINGSSPVRALICEDEPLARRAMEAYLAEVEWIEVVGSAATGKESLRLINKHDPDLVFLDVRMPGMSGLEVLDALDDEPAIVFTTAFDEYAVSAFEHGAVDYLVKPFGRERLLRTLDRVRVRLAGEGRPATSDSLSERGDTERPVDRIFARHRGAIVPVPVTDILQIDAVDGGVAIRTSEHTLDLVATLGEMQRKLDPADFVRVHRAHIVNLSRVRGIRRYDERRLILTLDDDSTLVASRAGSQALRGLMG